MRKCIPFSVNLTLWLRIQARKLYGRTRRSLSLGHWGCFGEYPADLVMYWASVQPHSLYESRKTIVSEIPQKGKSCWVVNMLCITNCIYSQKNTFNHDSQIYFWDRRGKDHCCLFYLFCPLYLIMIPLNLLMPFFFSFRELNLIEPYGVWVDIHQLTSI